MFESGRPPKEGQYHAKPQSLNPKQGFRDPPDVGLETVALRFLGLPLLVVSSERRDWNARILFGDSAGAA